MECYQHSGVAAVGICAHCGKAGCNECLSEGQDSRLQCRRCAENTPPVAGSAALNPGSAASRIRTAWIIAVLGAVGAYITYATSIPQPAPPLSRIGHFALLILPSLMCGYVAWATFFAAIALWRWEAPVRAWLRRLPRAAKETLAPTGQAVIVVSGLYILWFVFAYCLVAFCWYLLLLSFFAAVPVGALGVGIMEFWRCRRAAAGMK